MKRLQIPKFSRQQISFIVALVVLAYISIATISVIAKNYQLQQQLDELAAENELLALQNQQLEYETTYYQTDAFVEKEARAKLGLQAPGEQVVIFPELIPGPVEPPQPEPKRSLNQTVADNFRQWLFFLFRIEA